MASCSAAACTSGGAGSPIVLCAADNSTGIHTLEARAEESWVAAYGQVLGGVWLRRDVRQPVQDAHAGAAPVLIALRTIWTSYDGLHADASDAEPTRLYMADLLYRAAGHAADYGARLRDVRVHHELRQAAAAGRRGRGCAAAVSGRLRQRSQLEQRVAALPQAAVGVCCRGGMEHGL